MSRRFGRLSRRRLLVAGGLVAAGGGAWGWSRNRWRGAKLPVGYLRSQSKERRYAVTAVTRHLEDIRLSAHALDGWLDAFHAAVGEYPRPTSWKKQRRMARVLLASTDFFQTGADTERPARFVALWDPRINPCYNPFRRG